MTHSAQDLIRIYDRALLKKISARIIEAYKKKDASCLREFARPLGLETAGTGTLFRRLIFLFHPDRAARFHSTLIRLEEKGDGTSLRALARLSRSLPGLSLVCPVASTEGDPFEPVYARSPEDLSATSDAFDEDYMEGLAVGEYEEEEYGFIEAARAMMYGNLFSEFLPKDLLYLEGMLELPGEDIEDLTGIEYCRNITGLNLEENRIGWLGGLEELGLLRVLYLGHNRISDISPLKKLKNLRTLDLSFNEIEEAGELATLPELRYLNLIGNPLKDRERLGRLAERCILLF